MFRVATCGQPKVTLVLSYKLMSICGFTFIEVIPVKCRPLSVAFSRRSYSSLVPRKTGQVRILAISPKNSTREVCVEQFKETMTANAILCCLIS